MDIDSYLYLYKKTYFNLPRSVRSFLGSIYGSIPLKIRFGKVYLFHRRQVEYFENGSSQYQLDYMFNKSLETFQFAYDHIPHYTKLFDEIGFKPSDFYELDDFKKIPVLTKRMIQTNLINLYSNKRETPMLVHTGGSTFTPTKFYISQNTSRAKERAYNNFIFSKLSYNYRDKTLVFRGKDLSDEKRGIYWHYEEVANQLWISPNHLNHRFIEKIVEEINNFRPKFVMGYPHAVSSFIRQCNRIGIKRINGIHGVMLSSEILFSEQREMISEFFNCPVLSHYGHRESTSIGYRVDQDKYHFLNSYGVTRVVNQELITTSFDNFVMPFINYKTQDFVLGNSEFIGHSDIVINTDNIEGRLQDFIVMKDGTLRPVTGLGTGHFMNTEYIEAGQYFQEKPGELTLFIVSKNPERIRLHDLKKEIEKDMAGLCSLDFKFIDKIEKTAVGKWKTVIQCLDVEKYKY